MSSKANHVETVSTTVTEKSGGKEQAKKGQNQGKRAKRSGQGKKGGGGQQPKKADKAKQPKPQQMQNSQKMAGAAIVAMIGSPAESNPVRFGVLGETQPTLINAITTQVESNQAGALVGNHEGQYFAEGTGLVEIRADPLNHMISSTFIPPDTEVVGNFWYSTLDSTGDYIVGPTPRIYANDRFVARPTQCIYQTGKPSEMQGTTYYPMCDDGGRQYFWFPSGALVNIDVMTSSEINTGFLVALTVDVMYHTGAESYSLGSYSHETVVTELFSDKSGRRSHKRYCVGLSRGNRFGGKKTAELEIGVSASAKGGLSVPLASQSLGVQFTCFAGGYFSFEPHFTVSNASGNPVSSESGVPYNAVMTGSWTVTSTATVPLLYMLHQPAQPDGQNYQFYNTWAILGLSCQLMNKTPMMSEGGVVYTADIPQKSNWQKMLLESSDARQLWDNTSTIDPVSLLAALPAKLFWPGVLKSGAFLFRKTDINEVALTKYYDYNEITNAPNAVNSPLMCNSKSLLITYRAPKVSGTVTAQLLQFMPSMAYSCTTTSKLLPVDNTYVNYFEVMKVLQYLSNPKVPNKFENPSHVKAVFTEVLNFIRGTRAVVGQVAGLAGDVLAVANAFAAPGAMSRVGNSGYAGARF